MRRALTTTALAGVVAAGSLALTAPAQAEEFHWAGQTDPSTMDPHARNIAPVLSFLNNVYEGLVRRRPDMSIEPSLATSWEPIGEDGTEGWRFHLREGVSFHNGNEFTADDVLFSYERATAETSDVSSWFAPIDRVEVVDDYTVEFYTTAPNPLFPSSIANFMIMDRDWAEANNAVQPSSEEENYATTNANGTGPYELVTREPDIRTVLEVNEDWWDDEIGNITRAEFTPITSQATAVAALISGEVDFFQPIPLQDIDRLEDTDGVAVHQAIESRVIFFGFEHAKDDLDHDSVEGENPFQDPRVREAVYRAIDVDAIIQTIMRGIPEPVGLLSAPTDGGYSAEEDIRLDHDPDLSRELLAEAGYPDGFEFMLRCPNDRYINDEAVCTAVVGMLGQVGLDVNLVAEPVSQYFTNLREGLFDMYLLGWSSGTFDAEHPIRFLVHTPDPDRRLGSWNFGGYSNERIDELFPITQTEIDPEVRQDAFDQIFTIMREDVAYVPLYVQPIVWGAADAVDVEIRPDNFVILRWFSVEG
jgi:peptide/nickel transport system substrate-binding protein